MSLRILCGLLLCAFLTLSCNNEDVDTTAAAGPYIASAAPVLQNPDTHKIVIKTDSLAKNVRRAVKPKDVTVKDALKDMRFNPEAVKLFVSLADKTGGQTYFAKNSKMVAQTIVSILDKHTTEMTDVVLLIDKTGSMDDDIENVKKSAARIIAALKKFKNIQLAWGAYGDKNDDPANWFQLNKLSADLDASLDKINGLYTGGGGDLPESVNDAIYKTIDEMNWRIDARKMILVIGDAHSLEPPLADRSLNDVIKKCISSAIHINLFPVVISTEDIMGDLRDDSPKFTGLEEEPTEDARAGAPKTGNIIISTYPNPSTDNVYIDFTGTGPYIIDVKSLLGKTVAYAEVTTNRYTCNLLNAPAGIYLVTVTEKNTGKTEVRQVVKK
jgi:hypothetical protein